MIKPVLMNMIGFKRTSKLVMLFLSMFFSSMAQQHNMSKQYIAPTDPAVQQKLAQWQDLKFGLFMHWGTYSEWGVVESWSICPEDEGWTQRKGPYSATYAGYVKAYENLQTTFKIVLEIIKAEIMQVIRFKAGVAYKCVKRAINNGNRQQTIDGWLLHRFVIA